MDWEYVLIKGAGDLASGVACIFREAGYPVIMTEIEKPTCVRRKVAFAEAVYENEIYIRGIRGCLAGSFDTARDRARQGDIAVLTDPAGVTVKNNPPTILIDAVMAKKNLGTSAADAGIVIALGPGFKAGPDAHAVIETQRGPDMGKPIYRGTAAPDTGIPGNVLGYNRERVLRSPGKGVFHTKLAIGDIVNKGETVAYTESGPVKAGIEGVIRGLLRDGATVYPGMKVGDIHPEKNPAVCYAVTDKALAMGRGALEAVRTLKKRNLGGELK